MKRQRGIASRRIHEPVGTDGLVGSTVCQNDTSDGRSAVSITSCTVWSTAGSAARPRSWAAAEIERASSTSARVRSPAGPIRTRTPPGRRSTSGRPVAAVSSPMRRTSAAPAVIDGASNQALAPASRARQSRTPSACWNSVIVARSIRIPFSVRRGDRGGHTTVFMPSDEIENPASSKGCGWRCKEEAVIRLPRCSQVAGLAIEHSVRRASSSPSRRPRPHPGRQSSGVRSSLGRTRSDVARAATAAACRVGELGTSAGDRGSGFGA